MATAVGRVMVLASAALAGCGRGSDPSALPAATPLLTPQSSGTSVLLQAVSAPNADVAWISGHQGTYVRTTDGGATWITGRVPGADTLQFRDVYALDSRRAWLMSAGPGALSRIYRTTDAGATWTLQFTNEEPEAFYDCMDFWDERRGVAFSDQVGGRIIIRTTADGGGSWNMVPATALPPALPGEGGFAASGTCLVTRPGGHAWIATGNAPRSRVLHTGDYGRTWEVFEMPVVAGGEAAGLATITFRDDRNGAALGGEIGKADTRTDNVALTSDGGRTWRAGGRPRFAGAVFGASFVPTSGALVAVGPGGADLSRDGGMTWTAIDSLAYWGIGFSPQGTGWLAGPKGRITRVSAR